MNEKRYVPLGVIADKFKKIIKLIIGDKIYSYLVFKKNHSHYFFTHFRVRDIQIDITYRCNKLCSKCNRFCNLTKLPYFKDTDMRMEQIEKLIGQIKKNNIRLNRMQFCGGEPFLHPRLSDFISVVFYKLMVSGNVLSIDILTNGIIDPSDALKDCRRDSNINKAFNEGKINVYVTSSKVYEEHVYVLAAPVDLGFKWGVCIWPRACGISLNNYGYWPCAACGSIAILYGMTEYAKHDFPVKFWETWPNLKKDICKYCAAGCKELVVKTNGQVTPSYKKAISTWMRGEFSVPEIF